MIDFTPLFHWFYPYQRHFRNTGCSKKLYCNCVCLL